MLIPRAIKEKRPGWADYMASRAETARDKRLRHYYGSWRLAPETPISAAPLIGLDMETTGLDESRHAIVSIGVVPFTLNRIQLSCHRYWLVRPPRPLNARSVTLHHITHSALAEAPDLDAILGELLDAMAGRLPVVHYRNIERPFLNAAVKSRLEEELLFPLIDTMELEAQVHRQSRWARFKALLGRQPTSIRLHGSRLRYGLPGYQPHHAVIDALATAELLQAQIAYRYNPQTPVGDLWY
ncbi:MAG: 3'-5' exonuclease [Ectothiorhodospiraceae bacterium]|nr:3'-5' exonuclease [Ectothiorhodospiraceae bacterium]MCH8505750.1 3'-5' exonuclease [Ectothiorhodospiraceae bacterium]